MSQWKQLQAINDVISSNGNIILAALASILASVYWAHKKIRSSVRDLYWSSQKIELKINHKTAELVVKQFFPSIGEEEKRRKRSFLLTLIVYLG